MNAKPETQQAVFDAQIALRKAAQDYVLELMEQYEAAHGKKPTGIAIDGPLDRMLGGQITLGGAVLFPADMVVNAP